jgi:hypothetical protein
MFPVRGLDVYIDQLLNNFWARPVDEKGNTRADAQGDTCQDHLQSDVQMHSEEPAQKDTSALALSQRLVIQITNTLTRKKNGPAFSDLYIHLWSLFATVISSQTCKCREQTTPSTTRARMSLLPNQTVLRASHP